MSYRYINGAVGDRYACGIDIGKGLDDCPYVKSWHREGAREHVDSSSNSIREGRCPNSEVESAYQA